MQLEKSISVFRNKTTLSEPIHPSHKTFGLAWRILTGLVRPFLELTELKMGSDSLPVSFLLAINTEGRRALVTPEPRQQGGNDTSADTAAWLRLSMGDGCSESGSCYEICLPQRSGIRPWWAMRNTPN